MANPIFSINDASITAGTTNDTYDIGTTSVKFRNLYISRLITVGTVSASGAIIGVGGSISGTITLGTVSASGSIISTTGSFAGTVTAGTFSATGALISTTGSILNTLTVGTVSAGGNIIGNTTASGYYLKEGTNASMGTVTLASGTANVTTTKITANSRIFLTAQATGAVVGSLGISSRSAGTSFAIQSSSVADDRNVAWIIFEPA